MKVSKGRCRRTSASVCVWATAVCLLVSGGGRLEAAVPEASSNAARPAAEHEALPNRGPFAAGRSRAEEAAPMEPALRAALVRSVMAEASGQARYALATEGGALVASHPSQDLRARFDAEALTLSDRSGGQPVRLSLSRVNGQPAGRASVRADGNRVELSRGALTEWWVHGALGLEQGFTLARAPAGSAGEVVLELAVEAPGYVPEERSGSLALVRGSREVRVRDLYAEDAAGRALPAQMAWRAGGLELRVVTAGARYPVVIDPTWSEQQKLTASDAAWNDDFGTSVALSGDTAVVGAPFDDDAGSASGSAYVFVRSGTRWSQQQKLTASDAAPNDDFGLAVALSGDTAVVGAIGDDDAGRVSGAAYVFVRSGTRWSEQQKLTASDAAAGIRFGNSVAVSGDTAVVGAYADDSAYVFVRPSAVCGNAVVEPGEACDGGACCTSRCAFASSETTCTGTSNGGPCDDTSDRCSGTANTCVDRFLTTMCRRTAGECDAAEVCTGTTGSCPPDAAAAPGSPCGGAPSGACDAQDTCAGSVGATASCQANFLPSSTACRPDVGDCDVEELCTGSDAVCPADVPIPDCAMSDGGASMPDGGASVPDGGATAEDTGALVLDAGPVDASFPGDGADIDPLDAGPRVARSGGCGFRCAVLGVRDRGHRGALALALLAVLGTLARRRRP